MAKNKSTNSKQLKEFIKQHSSFWWVPEQVKEKLNAINLKKSEKD